MSLRQQILQYSRQNKLGTLLPWFDSALDRLIDSGIYATESQLEQIGQKLVDHLRAYSKHYNINTVALGMSGGVDSALTAALFKQAGWRVIGVTMPIHQNPAETARGIEACNALDIEHMQVDLTNMYNELLCNTAGHDPQITAEESALRRGNLRVRLRMITVYNIASANRGLVGSTDNFSELAAGFWTLHGDVGDLAPIQSLNKSWEVPKLAELYGVPASTVFATPTDGLGISASDEHQFGFSYLEFDTALLSIIDLYAEDPFFNPELVDQLLIRLAPNNDVELDKLGQILGRIRMSTFKRNNPYNLSHPIQNIRYSGLESLDRLLWK